MSEEGKRAVAIGQKAAAQIGALMETIRHNNDQLNAFLAGARAALDLPDDWRFDVGLMAFCAPPSQPEPEPEQGVPVYEE